MHRLTTLERAFEIARSGKAKSMKEVRQILTKEKHEDVQRHMEGVSIRKQLIVLMDAAAAQKRG